MAQQVLSLAIFVVLGRILAPDVFGVVSTALVFVFLMRSTVLNAVSTSLVTLRSPTDDDYDAAFWILAGISSIAVLVLNVLAGPLARLYAIPAFESVLRATSAIILLFGLGYAHHGWARRNFRFKALAIRNVAGVAAGGVVGISAALLGHGLAALVLNQVVAGIVSLALLWRFIPWKPRLRFSAERARPLMATALPLGATQGLQFAVQNFDTALVTFLLGPFGGGLYAAAKRITLAVQLAIWQPISAAVLPAFVEMIDDAPRLGRAIVRTGAMVMALTVPLFTAIGIAAPALIATLFGARWLPAAPILTILSLFGAVVPSVGVLHQIVIAKGRTRAVLYFTILQTAVALAAIAAFGDRDASAIALCLTAPALLTYVLTIAFVTRIMPFPLGRYLLEAGRPIGCAALMAAAMLAVPDLRAGPLVQLVALLGAGGFVYVIALPLIARDTFGEVVAFFVGRLPERWRAKGTRR